MSWYHSDFVFGPHLRWGWGFDNPNDAGLLIAILATTAATIGLDPAAGRARRFATLLAEGLLLFALCKTFSRGGLVATCVVYGVLAVASIRSRGSSELSALRWICVRFALAAALVVFTGFSLRVSPKFVGADRSVLNRISFWDGAVAMVADRPFAGYGIGAGPRFYSNWYQELSERPRVGSMVNGYLEVAIAGGLLPTVLLLGVYLTAVALLVSPQPFLWRLRTGPAVLTTFAVCTAFNSAGEIAVVFPALLAFIALVWQNREIGLLVRFFSLTCLAAILVGGGFGLRALARNPTALRVEFRQPTLVSIASRESSARLNVLLLADPRVLGEYPGRAVRDMVTRAGARIQVTCSLDATTSLPNVAKFDLVIATGSRWRECLAMKSSPLVIIHPLDAEPGMDALSPTLIVLPEVGEQMDFTAIQLWASRFDGTVRRSRNCGIEALVAWKEICVWIGDALPHDV